MRRRFSDSVRILDRNLRLPNDLLVLLSRKKLCITTNPTPPSPTRATRVCVCKAVRCSLISAIISALPTNHLSLEKGTMNRALFTGRSTFSKCSIFLYLTVYVSTYERRSRHQQAVTADFLTPSGRRLSRCQRWHDSLDRLCCCTWPSACGLHQCFRQSLAVVGGRVSTRSRPPPRAVSVVSTCLQRTVDSYTENTPSRLVLSCQQYPVPPEKNGSSLSP